MQILRKTLAQEVADRLTEEIVNGDYAVGEKLPIEPELMKIYGVGRSSIREAIKILSIQGILQVQQGVGTFIVSKNAEESLDSQMNKSNAEEIQEVRSILDAKIAAKAALHRSEKDLKTIKHYLDERGRLAGENNASDCYQADINFHTAIAESCGNILLKEIYTVACRHLMKFFEESHKNEVTFFKLSQKIHTELYEAIEKKDPETAARIAQFIVDRIY